MKNKSQNSRKKRLAVLRYGTQERCKKDCCERLGNPILLHCTSTRENDLLTTKKR